MLVMYNPYDVFPDRTTYCVGTTSSLFCLRRFLSIFNLPAGQAELGGASYNVHQCTASSSPHVYKYWPWTFDILPIGRSEGVSYLWRLVFSSYMQAAETWPRCAWMSCCPPCCNYHGTHLHVWKSWGSVLSVRPAVCENWKQKAQLLLR